MASRISIEYRPSRLYRLYYCQVLITTLFSCRRRRRARGSCRRTTTRDWLSRWGCCSCSRSWQSQSCYANDRSAPVTASSRYAPAGCLARSACLLLADKFALLRAQAFGRMRCAVIQRVRQRAVRRCTARAARDHVPRELAGLASPLRARRALTGAAPRTLIRARLRRRFAAGSRMGFEPI